MAAAPKSATPLQAVITGVESAGIVFQGSAERSQLRQSIIDATPELQARNLSKMSALSAVLTQTLQERGVAASTAQLAAEVGVVVLNSAFQGWLTPANALPWAELVRAALEELRAVISD